MCFNVCFSMCEKSMTPRIPDHVKKEAWIMAQIGGPTGLTMLARVAIGFTDISFLGHLGTEELAASSIALVWCTITTAFLYRGVCAATNALCSQALGAGNLPLMGIWLKIGFIGGTIGSLLTAGLWGLTQFVVELMGVSPKVAALACTFTNISILWIWPQTMFLVIFNWLQSQRIVAPGLIVSGLFVLVNFALNWIFIFGIPNWFSGLGFVGSPLATSVTRWLMFMLFAVYCFYYKKYHVGQWQGWSFSNIQPKLIKEFWSQVWPIAVSSTVEELQLQVIAVMASHLGDAPLATHSAVLEFFILLTTFMFGLVTSSVVRTGYHLGRRDVTNAQLVLKISFVFAVILSVPTALLIYFIRYQMPHIFSTDPEVASLCIQISPLIGGCYVLLSLFYTAFASLRGQGRPKAIAVAFFVGAWLVSVPLAYVFAFVLKQGLIGLWYGLIIGYFIITLMLLYALFKTNWEVVADAAVKRSSTVVTGTQKEAETVALTSEADIVEVMDDFSINYDANDVDGEQSSLLNKNRSIQ